MAFNPTENQEALDIVILGGRSTAGMGYAWLEGFGAPRKYDEQAGTGTDGASLKFGGLGLTEGTLHIQCWLPSHFEAWADFQSVVKAPKPGGPPPSALDLRHAVTDDLDVNQVVVTDEGQWTQVSDDGLWERTIRLKKYKKPKPMLSTPTASIDKPGEEFTVPTKEDLALQEAQRANAQADQGLADEMKRVGL